LIHESIEKEYGNRLRLRVAGICIEKEEILLVDHSGLNQENQFWAPPGGGVTYGETIEECLIREIKEETDLNVQVGEFLCVSEYLNPPLHAVELFFEVTRIDGAIEIGSDPEVLPEDQIIKSVEFLNFSKLSEIQESNKHSLLKDVLNSRDLKRKIGYFKFPEGR